MYPCYVAQGPGPSLSPSKGGSSRRRRDEMVCRLLLILLMVTAAEAVAFRIPRPPPAFGVRRVTAEQCLYTHDYRGAAPFFLGTAAAIHTGSTKSCIAGYYGHGDPGPAGSAYRFCTPFEGGILSSEAVRNHAVLSPLTRLQDPLVKKEMEQQCNFTRQLGSAPFELQAQQAQAFSPQVAGTLISELKSTAEAHLGREIEYAVLTVPRHVTYHGRQGVRFAGMVYGGFRSVKVVDEQIAAAAAHGHHLQPGDGKVVLVFHVGGRTTHATVFKFVNGMAWYINARDDLFFGGDDFTQRLVDHFVELIKQQHRIDVRHDKAVLLRLRAECERAKKTLSHQEEALVQVELLVDGVDLFSAPLTRAKFEELNHDLFERAVQLLDWTVMNAPVVEEEEERKGALRDFFDAAMETVTGRSRAAQRRKALIDEIVLVGGSSKIPMIRELVKDYFHGRDPNPNPNEGGMQVQPDEAVIHGALLLTRPEAAGYLEECYHPWSWGPRKTVTDSTFPGFGCRY